MAARAVMVLGTSSGAGKSWLATALCRYYAREGFRVAPFKAQNMSNNARVVATPEGGEGEIGAAQYFQALAAGVEPDVRMNPLLLKPEADTRSQVVLLGRVDPALSALPWRARGAVVWPRVAQALDALRAEHDVVVIEGAGSPAEINLMDSDIVNLRVARHAQARCLLVADIDRGGAFAHLYGTWALLPPEDRARIRGFVLNKFRGDAALLAPAPERLQALTGISTVATVPLLRGHGLPEEDGVFDDRATACGAVRLTVAVVVYPRISNLDEFEPLRAVPGVRLVWARTPADVVGADWIILPGSKATVADLAWLRAQGLDQAVVAHAARGGAVLGICGGLQMLGEAIVDPHGVEAVGQGDAPGLGLLPLVTAFERQKTVRRTRVTCGRVAGPWAALSALTLVGYEIHHGQTVPHPAMVAAGARVHEVVPGLVWQNAAGNVLGCYVHGLFENAAVLRALFGAAVPTLETVFDRLADTVARSFAPGTLDALVAKE
ncbi:cobyric acid synthase [Tepidimonas taiwanensis]|uniref:Cobyric acid synthase n=1 Tax=Tepidimonas taiwanensis TaxID=307486 RepID=A0A554XDB8_9BURK|nr:cobyric acid synthase [Tepidimonas taiwanensis]MCX7693115.1 cobyric acid synthase [Tepidimonas taiwanensis]MDM7463842.1 cobyric acid synthase [Tepidimonas taiwanensis]TSE33826.1 Cobyric acid synthase [Tepidimonas taiwanensis]UBQ06639.1 cobyric acid synthase [Tepidimonas taiwanensis]